VDFVIIPDIPTQELQTIQMLVLARPPVDDHGRLFLLLPGGLVCRRGGLVWLLVDFRSIIVTQKNGGPWNLHKKNSRGG
jgi:hypothetical protein